MIYLQTLISEKQILTKLSAETKTRTNVKVLNKDVLILKVKK